MFTHPDLLAIVAKQHVNETDRRGIQAQPGDGAASQPSPARAGLPRPAGRRGMSAPPVNLPSAKFCDTDWTWGKPGDDRARGRAAPIGAARLRARHRRRDPGRRARHRQDPARPGAARESCPAGTIVLVGQAEPGSLGRPFELLLSALDGRTTSTRHQLEMLTTRPAPRWSGSVPGCRSCCDLTAAAPAVVVFEDLHWADSESIALFERIADLEGNRLLLGTYRPAEVMPPQPDRRAAGPAGAPAHRVPRPAGAARPGRDVVVPRRGHRQAAAVPGGRRAAQPDRWQPVLPGGAAARPASDVDELCEQPLPWSLAEALRRQVEHLEPGQQRLVEAAAVLGYRIPFDLLASVTGRAETDLIWALRELVAQGVLVETGEDEFAFRHALVREAMGERLLGRERRRLHEAALTALLATGDADWALVAKHARGAGRYDDMLDAARRGSAAYLAIGSAFQALAAGRDGPGRGGRRPGAARRRGPGGVAGRAPRRRRHVRPALAGRGRHSRRSGRRAEPAGPGRLGDPGPRRDERAERRAPDCVRRACRRGRSRPARWPCWPSRRGCATSTTSRWTGPSGPSRSPTSWAASPASDWPRWWRRAHCWPPAPATLEEGRALLAEVADAGGAAGEWLLAALALNKLVHLPPSTSPGGTSPTCWSGCAPTPSGPDRRQLAVAAYYQGRGRLFMQKGNLAAAIDAIERGRAHDLGYRRTHDPVGLPRGLPGRTAAGGGRPRRRRPDHRRPRRRARHGHRHSGAGVPHRLPPRRRGPGAGPAARGGRDRPVHRRPRTASSCTISSRPPSSRRCRSRRSSKLIDGLDGPTVEPAYRGAWSPASSPRRRATRPQLSGHYIAAADSGALPPAALAPRTSARPGA